MQWRLVHRAPQMVIYESDLMRTFIRLNRYRPTKPRIVSTDRVLPQKLAVRGRSSQTLQKLSFLSLVLARARAHTHTHPSLGLPLALSLSLPPLLQCLSLSSFLYCSLPFSPGSLSPSCPCSLSVCRSVCLCGCVSLSFSLSLLRARSISFFQNLMCTSLIRNIILFVADHGRYS